VNDEILRRDVHPAEILMPSGDVLTACRVWVTSHRLLASRAVKGQIERVVDLALAEPFSVPADRGTLNNGQLECRTIEGTAWVNRGRGCGCGSPLKALGPPVPWTRREREAA
jgi:hypothetical protein